MDAVNVNFDPSLWALVAKVIYFLIVAHLTGWAISPTLVFRDSRLATWVFFQSLGISALLLVGFNLVSFDVPAKWVVVAPFAFLFSRLVINWKFPRVNEPYSGHSDSLGRSLIIYVCGSSVITTTYLMPFILLGSSGLYAFGGGDQSTYFSISDFVVNQSLRDLMLSWGLVWPPTESFQAMTANSNMLPPTPSWSINSFLFYLKYARQSFVFANQTIGVPFIALGPGNSIESYSAGVTVYFLLLCWSAAIFSLIMVKSISHTWTLSIAAGAVALATPAMSLVLKHTIPAVYAWGSMLMFLSIFFKHTAAKSPLKMSLPFGVAIATTYLMYLPALFVSGPLWLYCFIKNIKFCWKEKIKWVLGVLLVLLITTNLEIDRPIILFFSNAVGALLDYRLDLEKLHLSLLGVVDFETILSGRFSNLSANLAVLTVLGGLFCYVKLLNKQIKPVLVFVVPILFAITYYWLQGGQYHVIRMTEFLGVVLVAMAIAGLTFAYNSTQKIRIFVILILGGLFLINAVIIKVKINNRVLSATPDIRAGVIDAHDIQLVESLEHEFSNLAPQPVVYWLGWGAVPFANHEILFRNLKYVEAFEYDYSYVGMDILAPQYLNDALLIYPNDGSVDILHIKGDVLENVKLKRGRRVVQRVSSGSGAAIIGTGWMSPTIEGGKTVRYLRSAQEGGLVVWSEEPKTVQIEIEASGVEAGMFLTLRKPEQEYEVPLTDKFIFRQEDESSEQYFLRIQKSMAQNESVSAAIYNVQDEFRGHMDLSVAVFNERLSRSDLFKLFIILNIEAKAELTVNLVEKYQQQQLTYKLNAFHDKDPTLIRFKLSLNKGANILRFIGRDSNDRRSGRDAKTGIFYNPTINVPYIVVRKINISQPDADLIIFK